MSLIAKDQFNQDKNLINLINILNKKTLSKYDIKLVNFALKISIFFFPKKEVQSAVPF